MSRDGDNSMLIPAIGSFAIHAVLAIVCAEIFSNYRPWLAGFAPNDVKRSIDEPFIVNRSASLGSRDGIGFASNASQGERQLEAPFAPTDQAFLSRDPIGRGRVGNLPSMALAPAVEDSGESAVDRTNAQPSVAAVLPPPTLLHTPLGIGTSINDLGRPRVDGQALHVAVASAARAQRADNGSTPGGGVAPADPAPMSDSESDPFSKTGRVDFRSGKMEVRFGRAFKSVRPRLSLAAQLDLLGLKSPRIVLKIAIDVKGKVTDVEVLRSSGSKLVDQPVTVAMYQWWFEPAKNADGKPIADEIVLPISWH